MTRWEHRTVLVATDDVDRAVNALGAEGWEPYAAVAGELYGGPGALDATRVIVLLRREI